MPLFFLLSLLTALTKITFPADIDPAILASQTGFLHQSNLDMKTSTAPLPAPVFNHQNFDAFGGPAANELPGPAPFEASPKPPVLAEKLPEAGTVKVSIVPFIVRNNDLTLRESMIW